MSQKVLQAAEALVAAIKEMVAQTGATASRRGNRTPPVTTYRGGSVDQDLIDVARRFVRYSKAGKKASKKERNIARKVMKAFKARRSVQNTNGVDVFTHNGA